MPSFPIDGFEKCALVPPNHGHTPKRGTYDRSGGSVALGKTDLKKESHGKGDDHSEDDDSPKGTGRNAKAAEHGYVHQEAEADAPVLKELLQVIDQTHTPMMKQTYLRC